MKPIRATPVAVLLAGLALMACRPTYVPPDTPLPLHGGISAGTPAELVHVKAYFLSRGITELNNASCVMTYGHHKVRFNAPHKIAVPVTGEQPARITVICEAVLGAAKRTAKGIWDPAKTRPKSGRSTPNVLPVYFE